VHVGFAGLVSVYGLISQIGYRCEKSKPESVPAAIISKKGDTRPAFASLLLRNFQETSRMPDDDPPSDDAPQGLAETPAITPGILYDERHFIGGMPIDITEQQHAEEKLRDSGESVRRLIDAIPQIVWINNVDGIGSYFNRRWYEYTGLNYEQSAGPGWQAVIHPDDSPVSKERWQGALETGEVFECEYRLRNAAGEYRWFIGRNVPMRDNNCIIGWLGSATDIHDLKQAESGRRESEERYRLMVDGARDYAIFMVNPSNEIVYWSAGAERVFGWSAAEAVGESGEIVFTPEDRENKQEEKEIETALREGCASDRRWHMRKNGTRIWVDGVMRRLDDEKTGALRGFAKIARDATEQHEAEKQLRRAHNELERRVQERTAELERANAKLRQAMEQRQMLEKQILRITEQERVRISQDLHDSLCQELTGTAFLLKSRARAIEGQSRVAADSLVEAADTVNANAQMARELARGLHPIEIAASGLPSALRELCSRMSSDVSCHCDCPRFLRIDQNVAVNLYRIAQEALTNSMKHAKASEITVCLERTNGAILLTVKDDGQGKSRGGRGLGTLMMEYRANAIGGTLRVESTQRRGTSVTCRVPHKR
jgi:PAS domain S-box-containing protein